MDGAGDILMTTFLLKLSQCLGRATFLVGEWLLAELWGLCGMSWCWKQRKTLSLTKSCETGALWKGLVRCSNQNWQLTTGKALWIMNLMFISFLACSHVCTYTLPRTHIHGQADTRTNICAHTQRKHTTHPCDTQINVIFETRTYERMVMQVLACLLPLHPRLSNSCPSAKEFSWLLAIMRAEILGPSCCPWHPLTHFFLSPQSSCPRRSSTPNRPYISSRCGGTCGHRCICV